MTSKQTFGTDTIKRLVDRFLTWPLPSTVCSDLCATEPGYKFPRSGTNLLNADEARQMIEHLLADAKLDNAPARPTEESKLE